MAKLKSYIVYWLHDQDCVNPMQHGYIGVTSRQRRRMVVHRYERHFPEFEMTVLFRGTRSDCLQAESVFRPHPHIGWNKGRGGFVDGRSTKGVPKSEEQKAKMREAALRRYADPAERIRTSKAVKRGLKDIDRSGANNSRFGKPVSEATKQKMRDRIIERGGIAGQKNPNYRHGRYV